LGDKSSNHQDHQHANSFANTKLNRTSCTDADFIQFLLNDDSETFVKRLWNVSTRHLQAHEFMCFMFLTGYWNERVHSITDEDNGLTSHLTNKSQIPLR